MTRERMDGLQIVLFGAVLLLLVSAIIAQVNFYGMSDFKQFYYASRCLIEHHDPYNERELWAVYMAEAKPVPTDPGTIKWLHEILLCPNMPTTFLAVAPVALLPWKAASWLWLLITGASFIGASYLIWKWCADAAPRYAATLVFLILVTSSVMLSGGNTAALVIGLTVIAVWCFVSERLAWAGIVCLAVSLAIKPHDAGFVWLYFLLAGGVARKRALQTLAVTALIALPAVLWISHAVPHWPQELSANLHAITARGGQDDPGPQSGGALGVMMMVSLQTIFSRFRDDPGFYNPATYVFCVVPVAIWTVKTLRTRYSPVQAWYALAAIVPFSMLVVYHRCYDCRLLLLAVPACVDLWLSRSPARWWALSLTLAGIIVTGDLLWIVVFQFTKYSRPSLSAGMIPGPIVLAALGSFYLWIYVKRPDADEPHTASESMTPA